MNTKRLALFAALLAGLLLLQFGFVRQLMAAEVLFGLGLFVLFALGLLTYLVGSFCERSFQFARVSVRVMLSSSRRGFRSLEEAIEKSARA